MVENSHSGMMSPAEAEEAETGLAGNIEFFLVTIALGIFWLYALFLLNKFRIVVPYSLMLYLSGLLLGYLYSLSAERANFEVPGHFIFEVLLPPVLFEAAANFSFHVFRKVLFPSILLAGPAVLLNIGLVTLFLHFAFGISWLLAGIAASILSATDPVAVVASLASLGAPPHLAHLIEGESLLNDGSSAIVFVILTVILGSDKRCDLEEVGTLGCIFRLSFTLAVVAPFFGIFTGLVTSGLFRIIRLFMGAGHWMLELLIILGAIYVNFHVAELAQVSGVLATVVYGAYMSNRSTRSYVSARSLHASHDFVSMLANVANLGLFVIAGFVSVKFLLNPPTGLFWKGVVIYLILHVTRLALLLLFWPALRYLGYGMNFRELLFISFAGLRGAVGLALVLVLHEQAYHHRHHLLGNSDEILKEVDLIEGLVGLTVLFTLLINGSLAEITYGLLGIKTDNPLEERLVLQELAKIEEEYLKVVPEVLKFVSDIYGSQPPEATERLLLAIPDLRTLTTTKRGNAVNFHCPFRFTQMLDDLDQYNWSQRESRLGDLKDTIPPEAWRNPDVKLYRQVCEILTTLYPISEPEPPAYDTPADFNYDAWHLVFTSFFSVLHSAFDRWGEQGWCTHATAIELNEIAYAGEDEFHKQKELFNTDYSAFMMDAPLEKLMHAYIKFMETPPSRFGFYGVSYIRFMRKFQVSFGMTRGFMVALKQIDFTGSDHTRERIKFHTELITKRHLCVLEELSSRRTFYALNITTAQILLRRKRNLALGQVENGMLSKSIFERLDEVLFFRQTRSLTLYLPKRVSGFETQASRFYAYWFMSN